MHDVDSDCFTVDDFNLPVGRQPEFTPPSYAPFKKSYSDPSYRRASHPSRLPEYPPMAPPPAPLPSSYHPFYYSRSPTPLSEQGSSYCSNSHGFDVSF